MRARILVVPAVALFLLAAVATEPAGAATPRTGFWSGSKGSVTLSFTVRRSAGRLDIKDSQYSCQSVVSDNTNAFDKNELRRDGVVVYNGKRHGRLGRDRGRIDSPGLISSGNGSGPDISCPLSDFKGIPVTRGPFREIQDGLYESNGPGYHLEFRLLGDGAVAGSFGGGVSAPAPDTLLGACYTGPDAFDTVRLSPDGSFHAADDPGSGDLQLAIDGRASGSTVTGTYTLTGCPSPVTGPQPFTATLSEAAEDSYKPGDGGAGGSTPAAEPRPAKGSPYPGLPAADTSPGCSATVTAGPVSAVAACFRQRGSLSVARGRVRLNGLDVTPATGKVEVRIDRKTGAVTSSGPVELRVGSLSLLRGKLNWPRPDAVFEIKGGPGLPVSDQQLFGLPVDGSAKVQLTGGKTVLTVTVKIPGDGLPATLKRFAGYSGELRAAATNEAGLVLDGGKLAIPGGRIGFAEVQDAELAISSAGTGIYHFDGQATVFPFRFNSLGFEGQLGVGPQDGYFKLALAVEQLNKALVYGFFLQKLGGGFQINPFGLTAAAGVTFGPQFRLGGDLISAARLDGDLAYLSADGGDPASVKLGGALEIAEAKAADGSVTVKGDGSVDASGSLSLKVAGYGLAGKLDGWFDGARAFNVEGKATLELPGPDADGEAVLSTEGAGGCRRGFGPDVGFGYRWGKGIGGVTFAANSCSLGPWRAQRGAKAAQNGAVVVPVRRGLRQLAVRLDGTQGAVVQTPAGEQLSSAAGPDGFADERRLLVADPDTNATYLIVDAPQPGRWQLTPATPPTSVSTSAPLPRVRIAGSVRGGRALRYRARGLAGRRLRFVDVAGGSRKVLRTTGRARGRFRFTPAARGGRHTIRVLVLSQAGTPTGIARTVTRYRARRGRPARPRRVRIRRAGDGRAISWRGPRRLRYEVDVRLSDGRRVRRLARPGTRRVRVALVPRGVKVRASVVARDGAGRASRAGRGRG